LEEVTSPPQINPNHQVRQASRSDCESINWFLCDALLKSQNGAAANTINMVALSVEIFKDAIDALQDWDGELSAFDGAVEIFESVARIEKCIELLSGSGANNTSFEWV
jgi:hypothetical protein